MTAGELCSRVVVFAERNMGLNEAARLMREHHVGSLVVAQETGKGRVPVGILALDDVLEAVSEQITDLANAIASERTHEARMRP